MDALTIATPGGAGLLKLDDRGAVRPGLLADLIVLGANSLQDITNTLKINAVWHRGRLASNPLVTSARRHPRLKERLNDALALDFADSDRVAIHHAESRWSRHNLTASAP